MRIGPEPPDVGSVTPVISARSPGVAAGRPQGIRCGGGQQRLGQGQAGEQDGQGQAGGRKLPSLLHCCRLF